MQLSFLIMFEIHESMRIICELLHVLQLSVTEFKLRKQLEKEKMKMFLRDFFDFEHFIVNIEVILQVVDNAFTFDVHTLVQKDLSTGS